MKVFNRKIPIITLAETKEEQELSDKSKAVAEKILKCFKFNKNFSDDEQLAMIEASLGVAIAYLEDMLNIKTDNINEYIIELRQATAAAEKGEDVYEKVPSTNKSFVN